METYGIHVTSRSLVRIHPGEHLKTRHMLESFLSGKLDDEHTLHHDPGGNMMSYFHKPRVC